MAEKVDLSLFVERLDDGAERVELAVDGGERGLSLGEIESRLAALPGLATARLNLTTRRLVLTWSAGAFDPALALDLLEELGLRAYPLTIDRSEEQETRYANWLLKCLGVAGFAAMNIMLLSVSVWSGNVSDITPETRDFFHWTSALIALPAVAYAGQPFFVSALRALRQRELNMDVPISLGIVLALCMSVYETWSHAEHAYFDSAVMLVLFLLAGRTLDHMMRRKTRAAASNLASLKGDTAHRMGVDDALVTVPVAALQLGDRVFVKPGERVPADAIILSGRSAVDDSALTGETLPREVAPGERVHAGGLNGEGALTLRVTAAASGSVLDEVERLLQQASEAKSRYLRLADRVSRKYAPVVHVTALATAIGWLLVGAGLHKAIVIAIAVLIITCPCALALAVPAVQVVATGALFRSGVLLNSGDALERIATVDTVVFDKTGTLTLPEPRVANRGEIAPDLFATATRLALSSRHPLAMAAARDAVERRPYADAIEERGQGVRAIVDGVEIRLGSRAFCDAAHLPAGAEGASVIFVRRGADVARLDIRQSLRVDARETVAALKALGLDLVILSGDRPEPVAAVAADLGIADWRGGVTPAQKIAFVEELKAKGRKPLMVGDGLNDAPALAAASASISPIAAVDLARAQADAVFLGERLAPVLFALRTSRLANRLMRENLAISVLYNLVAVPLAVLGYVTPLIAAAAMSGSSLVVTLNALRARPRAQTQAAPQAASAAATRQEPSWTS